MAHRVRLVAIVIGLLAVSVGPAGAADPTLHVNYAMDCTFVVIGDNGAAVSVLAPGAYQVVVASPVPFAQPDLSGETDPNVACGGALSFRITGPGVSLLATLEDGDSALEHYNATFQPSSTYAVFDDHRPALRRVLSTSATASSTGSSGSSSSGGGGTYSGPTTAEKEVVGSKLAPFRGSLAGSVTTTGKLALSFKGKHVSSLKAGRYEVVVLDETSKSSFKLQRLGKAATTLSGLSFVGRRTVTITLQRGQWMFYSASGKKSYFIVVA